MLATTWGLKLGLLLSLIATGASASNGTNLIGISPTSVGLGGTGTGVYLNPTEALFRNPSLLTSVKGPSVLADFSVTLIKNNASSDLTGIATTTSATSNAKVMLLPEIAVAYRASDKFGLGLGVLTYGGAQIDYTGATKPATGPGGGLDSHLQLKTDFALTRFTPAVAYEATPGLSFGASPVIEVGQLAINESSLGPQTGRGMHGKVAFGGHLGTSYQATEALRLGAAFITKRGFTFDNTLDLDTYGPTGPNGLDPIKLEAPSELSLGASYTVAEAWLFSTDLRWIAWSAADSYKELGWRDQYVIALGVQYAMTDWKFRAGFNYGRSPQADSSGEVGLTPVSFQGHGVYQNSLSRLNAVAFPAIAQTHITAGAGYAATQNLHLDLGMVLAFSSKVTHAGTVTLPTAPTTPLPYSYTGTFTQWAISTGATYQF